MWEVRITKRKVHTDTKGELAGLAHMLIPTSHILNKTALNSWLSAPEISCIAKSSCCMNGPCESWLYHCLQRSSRKAELLSTPQWGGRVAREQQDPDYRKPQSISVLSVNIHHTQSVNKSSQTFLLYQRHIRLFAGQVICSYKRLTVITVRWFWCPAITALCLSVMVLSVLFCLLVVVVVVFFTKTFFSLITA